MAARITQTAVEAVSSGGLSSSVRVQQQVTEVISTGAAPVQIQQQVIEVVNRAQAGAQMLQQAIEVVSTNVAESLTTTLAFMALEPTTEVVERLTWVTDVQAARSGAQTRVSLRTNPRMQIEYDVLATTADEVAQLDAYLTGWQADIYYVPVWQDRRTLAADMTPTTSMALDLTDTAYAAGGYMAFWTGPNSFEVVQLLTAATGMLIWATATAATWPAGTTFAPVRRAKLSTEAAASRFTGSVLEARMLFEVERPVVVERVEWGDGTANGPWIKDSLPLFTHTPNWSGAPEVTYSRRIRTISDDTSVPWRDDPSGRGWISRKETHTSGTRAEAMSLIRWAAQRRGRALPFLSPIRDTTLEDVQDSLWGDTAVWVKYRRLELLYNWTPGREYLALRDGEAWIVRKIASIEKDGDLNKINLTSTISWSLAGETWGDAFICEPANLDSDMVECRWWTDQVMDMTVSYTQVIK